MENPSEMRIIKTPFFVVDKVKRSWAERLFSWPWRPWIKADAINVPSMVRIGNDIFCHPDLLSSAQRMLEHRANAGDECCNCEWTWDSATSSGQCEFCEKRQWLDEVD